MKLFTELHIDNNMKAGLGEIGLSKYKQFISYAEGELVSRPSKNPVRRIQLNINGEQKAYFLKQSPTTRAMKKLIRVILGGRWPHATAYGEMLAVRYYKKLGIPVMNPVCWGEKRMLGWPLSGFLLVEEINGKNFEIEYINSTSKNRKRLTYGYGSLIGYMHKNDVYDVVRCEEVICISDEVMDFRNMITIDREYSRKRKKRFAESDSRKLIKKAISLANTFLTDARSHILPMPSYYELLAFLAGYFSENNESNKARMELLNCTREVLNKSADDREKYKEIKLLINSI